MGIQLRLCLLLCIVANWAVFARRHVYDRNYEGKHTWKNLKLVATGYQSSHHMLELRIAQSGILTLDTMTAKYRDDGLYLREVTNGRDLISLIYNGHDDLVDCDIDKSPEDVTTFLKKFFILDESADWKMINLEQSLRSGISQRNGNLTKIKSLASEYEHYVDLRSFRDECRKLHHEIEMVFKGDPSANDIYQEEVINPEATLQAYFNAVDKDSEPPRNSHSAYSYSKQPGHSRSKREMFIFPGTKWCGSGNVAQKGYHDLGEDVEIDKCCRTHDHCPYTIPGWKTKWNYLNMRFHTLSHCDCDEKFLSCLKSKSYDSAEMLGNLFFNVMGTTCFVFKQEEVCVRRSWWGRCQKTKWDFTAEVREPQRWM